MTNQAKFNYKGQMIEVIDDSDLRDLFMSPKGSLDDGLKGTHDRLKAVLPKRDNTNNNTTNVVSILGKRKFNHAFESESFDDDRYGQHITSDFFDKNVGHDVIQSKQKTYTFEEEQEILQWCEYYLANKNLFNV